MDSTPRVLFLTLRYGPVGGLEIYNMHLVAALRNAGCAVDVWSVFDQPGAEPEGAVPLAPRGRLAMGLYFRFLWETVLHRRIMAAAANYDLVVCGHINMVPAVYTAYAEAGLPYWVWTYGREAWANWSSKVKRGMEAAQCIGALSAYTKTSITQRLPEAPVIVLHNPVDIARFKPSPEPITMRDHPVLLTVSRLSSRETYKGQDTVIQALPLVHKKLGGAVDYQLCGTGDDIPRLRRLANELGVDSQVRFLGWVPYENIVAIYQDCDIFVMPSKVERRPDGTWAGEGFGFVYIEAAACGKPVIGSNQGGATDALKHGITGFAVNPHSVEEVADAIYTLLANPDLAAQMGQAGRRFVEENFSMEVFYRRVADLLSHYGIDKS